MCTLATRFHFPTSTLKVSACRPIMNLVGLYGYRRNEL